MRNPPREVIPGLWCGGLPRRYKSSAVRLPSVSALGLTVEHALIAALAAWGG